MVSLNLLCGKMKNKRGWIRIVEAFIAILIIAGVLLTIINKTNLVNENISPQVYEAQKALLRQIETNDDMRHRILEISLLNLKSISWAQFESLGLTDIKNKIINEMPTYLECEAKICNLDEICVMDNYVQKEIYAQSVAVVADSSKPGDALYNPLQLKMFCWKKE